MVLVSDPHDSEVTMDAAQRARFRRNHEHQYHGYREPDNDSDDEQEEWGLIESIRKSFIFQMIKCLTEELCPCLLTSEVFINCFRLAKDSLRESPCTCFLTIFLMMFGFLPLLSFFLFLCGTFIFSVVCFIVCQGIAFTVGAVVFGGFFVFLVFMCCIMATVFGMSIHILSAWGWTNEWLSDNIVTMTEKAVNIFSGLKSRVKRLSRLVPWTGPWLRRWLPDDGDGDR